MRPDWLDLPIPTPSEPARARAAKRQDQLTKPPGSLGELERVAIRLAALQDSDYPSLDRVRIVVFAADHGIAAAGVSAFPQSVTVEMVRNFSRGGAAISVLARQIGAELEVVDVGTLVDPGPLPGVLSVRAGEGTADFRSGPAMSTEQLRLALDAGRQAALRGGERGANLLIGGEMGIGNTTAATAVGAALTGLPVLRLTGPGTGLDANGMSRKAALIEAALAHHRLAREEPLEILRTVGGFELVALTGFYLAAAQAGIPVLVDGFIATSSALAAQRLRPDLEPWLFFAHRSREPGHAVLLEAMDAEPLVSFGMRLGEGSGAAVVVPILRMACGIHEGMATFAEAGVSGG